MASRSRSPSRGRQRPYSRSPSPPSNYSRSPVRQRRYDSRSPSRSLTPPPPRRNGRYRAESRSWSRGRGRDSREPSESPLARSTKVSLSPRGGGVVRPGLTSGVCAPWLDCCGAAVEEYERGPSLRDIRPVWAGQGSRSAHQQDMYVAAPPLCSGLLSFSFFFFLFLSVAVPSLSWLVQAFVLEPSSAHTNPQKKRRLKLIS